MPQDGREEMLHPKVCQWDQIQVPVTLSKGQKNPKLYNSFTRRDSEMILYVQVQSYKIWAAASSLALFPIRHELSLKNFATDNS